MTMSLQEGTNTVANFESSENDPVPSTVTTQWTFNGQLLNSTNRTKPGVYSISFVNLERNDTGLYEIFVSNAAGTSISNLTLDVQCESITTIIKSLFVNTHRQSFPSDILHSITNSSIELERYWYDWYIGKFI